MKVVIDTNVLVSGIFWDGKPEQLLRKMIDNEIEVYASFKILNEYIRVIERIAKNNDKIVESWKNLFIDLLNLIEVPIKVDVCRDSKDNMFLECAIASDSEYLISGDNDLLIIKK